MEVAQPNPWMILPFGLLLALIALGPVFFSDWWLKHYPKVAIGLGAVTLIYYAIGFQGDMRGLAYHRIADSAHEYFSFIALLGALYIVSGGIHITVKGEATPHVNVIFLAIGAVLANILGTTGASMLLIRPWIRMNKYRITTHHVVFFIFIVSNVSGCLTPIGDPPLFLGFLNGVPFWWVLENCWPMWLLGVGYLLTVFYFVDRRNYLRAPKLVRDEMAEPPDEWHFSGLWNIMFIGVILVAVFINDPPFLREGLMIAAALGSYFTTSKKVHESNHFNFHPIQEVAILFVGIFATMMPALDWLQSNAGKIGGASAAFFFWSCGSLSSLLDNAPTYLSFLNAIFGVFVDSSTVAQVQTLIQTGGENLAMAPEAVRNTFETLRHYHGAHVEAKNVPLAEIKVAYLIGNAAMNKYLVAISVAAVFFGANTYIGNGPNFMVKSIADHRKIHTPDFLSYIYKWSLPIMVPMIVLVWLVFFL